MRLYSFVNALYLKEVQWGIQTAHAVAELYNKYPEDTPEPTCICYDQLNDWARNHKTIIILDGGNCWELGLIINQLQHVKTYAWSYFKEDSDSLNNAVTCVTMLLPENIYNLKAYSRDEKISLGAKSAYHYIEKDDKKVSQFLSKEEELVFNLIKNKQLAR